MRFNATLTVGAAALSSLLLVAVAEASDKSMYEVEITNVTQGQSFTPMIVVTDRDPVPIFALGDAASDELATLAEGGATGPLEELFEEEGATVHVDDGGLLGPGETRVLLVDAGRRARYLSLAGMLLPTNDTFVALNSIRLPKRGQATHAAVAYDAGTEENDQDCESIPGPLCGGEPDSLPAETDEGYVYVSNGFHDLGDEVLGPVVYDWKNPVAVIKIQRSR